LLQNWSQSFQLGITNLLWNFLSQSSTDTKLLWKTYHNLWLSPKFAPKIVTIFNWHQNLLQTFF
jgi:hypothetical protein